MYIIITIPAGAGTIGADKVKGINTFNKRVNYMNQNLMFASDNDEYRNFHLNEAMDTRRKLKKSKLYRE